MTHQQPNRPRPIRLTPFEILMLGWETAAIIIFSVTSNNANVCANALIGALSNESCTSWVAFHALSTTSMWLAAIAFVASFTIGRYNGR